MLNNMTAGAGVLGGLGRLMKVVLAVIMVVVMILAAGLSSSVSGYERPPPRRTLFVSPSTDSTTTSPQQVHISVSGKDGMRISWITKEALIDPPATVEYGTSSGNYHLSSSNGTTTSYKYTALYKSGFIHHVVVSPLKPNTLYYYKLVGSSREFTFKTPPSKFPINFAVVGDLGQTEHTRSTLDHIASSNYDMLLLPGDLSYADFIQPLWDSFGRLVEPLASQRPWMVTQGNHEIEKIPLLHNNPFTAYNSRWRMPFEDSGSTSNLYYSFDVAGGGVHVIMLGSYTDFERGSAQYAWLQRDLKSIDRSASGRISSTTTQWVIVLVHAPWYNSNKAHQGEYESVGMKTAMEELLYNARVDVVFQGHVHAYERFTRVFNGEANNCGPVYITIGDGGNREGLANHYVYPQPKISMFREASFGHGQLEIVNGTHAQWSWHRNDDDDRVVSDSLWLISQASDPACN